MVLVDSSIWIEALRRDGDVKIKLALKGLLDEYEAAWCSAVRLEVMGGARKEERSCLAEQFEVVPYFTIGEPEWDWAVSAAWRLRELGHQVKWNVLLIAATAVKRNLRVFAPDRHFEVLHTHLNVDLYQPGYNGLYNPGTS